MLTKQTVYLRFQFAVLAFSLEKGACDSICPNGLTNITGQTSGEIVFKASGIANETKCWRIEVPEPYEGIGIYYHDYVFEVCKNCECDNFAVSNNYFTLEYSGSCGKYSPPHLEYGNQQRGVKPSHTVSGRDIYLRIKTDDTVHNAALNISFVARSDEGGSKNVLNASEEEVIEFGTPKVGVQNYPESFEEMWYLIVPEGRQVELTFDTFKLEQSDNCENDYVEIREAYFDEPHDPQELEGRSGPILANSPYCGSTNPGTIQSAGNMVWVHFKSDSNATTAYKGFKASFKAGQGRLAILNPLTLPVIAASLLFASKESLF